MLQLIRGNIGLLITLGLLAGGTLVCTLVGLIMARAGASLRPIYWFAGFFALIVVPQVIGHFYKALQRTEAEAPRTAAMAQIANPTSTNAAARSEDAKSLFGPDADPQLITDVRRASGDVFTNAELAQFAVLRNGDTALLACFNSSLAAEKAWINYLRVSGLNQLSGTGDSQRGYVATRPGGDRAYALHLGNMVGIWTGKDDAAIRQRMMAGGFEIPTRAPLGEVSPTDPGGASQASSTPHKPKSPVRIALLAATLGVYVFIVVLYYFKGAAWAGTYPAKPGTPPLTGPELAAQLESINTLNVPFQIERGGQPNEFFATWRYADAKWIDLARAHGMKRTHRIRMTLDEQSGTVRATDYIASFDWSAGSSSANVEWKTGLGIVFFQYERQRVFGLQLDEEGRFKPELSYAYTFNLPEMKSPLIEAVTRAGWDWRPTVWQGPRQLRWLTE